MATVRMKQHAHQSDTAQYVKRRRNAAYEAGNKPRHRDKLNPSLSPPSPPIPPRPPHTVVQLPDALPLSVLGNHSCYNS